MKAEHWEELKAQVETHGPDAVEFLMIDDDLDYWYKVWVTNVEFSEGLVKVRLA